MPKISIIIRSKNEEKWIGHCLSAVFYQEFSDFEVILVDNESSDNTVEIASRYPISKVVNVEYFLPGLAINDGIRACSGEYIVCLSAHCVPKSNDWLNKLAENLDRNENVVGVYGRQLPVSFTDASDKRDLLIVFGEDKRVQVKDYFFHNANSMFRRDIWEKFPFDEKVTNIEDRVWGKKVINNGYNLIYEPEAAVYHHHGLHHGNNSKRAKGVISVIESIDRDFINDLPTTMLPQNSHIDAVIPIKDGEVVEPFHFELLDNLISELNSSEFIHNIYILSSDKAHSKKYSTKFIDRKILSSTDKHSLDQIMQRALSSIEEMQSYPESLLYVNHDYMFRPKNLFDDLITEQKLNGYDCTFPGLLDYGHYWSKSDGGDYRQSDSSMKSREQRSPIYKALYGLGCLSSSWLIRQGKMIDGKIGILPFHDIRFSMRRRESDYALIYDELKKNGSKLIFSDYR